MAQGKVMDFGAGTSSLQLYAKGRGSIPDPAKAKHGRLPWEWHYCPAAWKEAGGPHRGLSDHMQKI